jgi:hypothetical protein
MSRVLAVCFLALFIVSMVFAEEFTPIDKLERGMSATIKGAVTRILDEDEFRIQDETGSIRAYIGWKNKMVIPIGEKIVVRGFVDDDLESYFRPEFNFRDNPRGRLSNQASSKMNLAANDSLHHHL